MPSGSPLLALFFCHFALVVGWRWKFTPNAVSCDECNPYCEVRQKFKSFAEFKSMRNTLNNSALLTCVTRAISTSKPKCEALSNDLEPGVLLRCYFTNLADLEPILMAPYLTNQVKEMIGESTGNEPARKSDRANTTTIIIAMVLFIVIAVVIVVGSAYMIVRRIHWARNKNKIDLMAVANAQAHVINVAEEHNNRANSPPIDGKGSQGGSASTEQKGGGSAKSTSEPKKT
ncbi:hypothetical protein PRIPAC_73856 [Pristionchus pacificus]|uniref:Uncharacterized protein n=1 Tax=Pristionchus pacificus TaxID=54126 RepID=A0A2A6C6H5_PRIPA|nr:hypothetical protein PRIPAC_73856 [Pristionchus pacificus]|eukprot:PDM73774.1 hypothetical protein PRIPAC_41130 [Pristionchus pacificus]